jgi:hypothetical protein
VHLRVGDGVDFRPRWCRRRGWWRCCCRLPPCARWTATPRTAPVPYAFGMTSAPLCGGSPATPMYGPDVPTWDCIQCQRRGQARGIHRTERPSHLGRFADPGRRCTPVGVRPHPAAVGGVGQDQRPLQVRRRREHPIRGQKLPNRVAVSSTTRMALLAVLGASVGPVDGRRNQRARWVDYYLGRRGGPRAHPTGQPGAMAPQRRGAVAAPSRGTQRRQATLPRGRAGTISPKCDDGTPFHHVSLAMGHRRIAAPGRRCAPAGVGPDSATLGGVGPYRGCVPRARPGPG